MRRKWRPLRSQPGSSLPPHPNQLPRGTAVNPDGVINPLTINTTATNLAASSGKPDAANADTAAPDKTAGLADNGKPQAAPNGLETDKDKAASDVTQADAHRFANAPAQAAENGDTQAAAPKAPDAPQPLALTAPVQNAAPTPAIPAAAPQLTPQAAAIPLAGVGIEIAAKALEGKNHFEIRLDPPELGRIDVRLDVDRDGNVTTRLIADRTDTLDLLRRDASGLERALQDAGLKTAGNGMQFQLRDQTMGQDQRPSIADVAQLVANDTSLGANEPTQTRYSRHSGGLDIRSLVRDPEKREPVFGKDYAQKEANMTSIASTPLPTSSGTANGAGAVASTVDSTEIASNFTEFLQLLTTQLQNQNPLDPLDTNQFTQQLVQFAQVEQQLKSNTSLSTLVSLQQSAQATSALAFVGATVVVNGAIRAARQ